MKETRKTCRIETKPYACRVWLRPLPFESECHVCCHFSDADDGRNEKAVVYFDQEEHEKACPYERFPCPATTGCGFAGCSRQLWTHCVTNLDEPHGHWEVFSYFQQFDFLVKTQRWDWYLLRSRNDGQLFVVNLEPVAPPLGRLAVSIVCVPGRAKSKCGCSLSFSCFEGHHGSSNLSSVPCSSLLDGLPKDIFCVVPYAPDRRIVMLRVTIDTEMDYDGVEDLEDDEDHGSYHGDDEDDDQLQDAVLALH